MKRWKVLILAVFLCLNLLLCSLTFMTFSRKPGHTNHNHRDTKDEVIAAEQRLNPSSKLFFDSEKSQLNQLNRPTTRTAIEDYDADGGDDDDDDRMIARHQPHLPRRSEMLELQALLSLTLKPAAHLCRAQTRLLVSVCSSLDHFERREAVRKTWGNRALVSGFQVAIVFIVGLPEPRNQHLQTYLEQEHSEHDDIVQLNHIDHYKNLSLKSLGMLHWAVDQCPSAKYYLKTDDDVYLNVPRLIQHLNDDGYTEKNNFILGSIIQAAQPVRNRMSKWFTPNSVYRADTYPPYTSGTAYLVSRDAAMRISEEGKNHQIFWLEDIFVTGILAKKLDVELIHDARFSYRKRKRQDLCWYKQVFTEHDLSVNEIHRIWTFADFSPETNRLLWSNCTKATEVKTFESS